MTPAIELRELCVSAGRERILGPIELVVEEREHVLVVGRSGSGKTTLLRAVAGLARLERGRVAIGGKPASHGRRLLLDPSERGIGFLFQGGALWPHMSAAGNLRFVLAQRRVPRSERARRAQELLELVELDGFADRMPATLSGGEAQRLSLARALACEPRILLLDEPLGPLDAELRTEMLRRLREVEERLSLTVLHVTHDPAEAAALADRTLRLEAGRIAGEERSGDGARNPAAGAARKEAAR